MKKKKDLWITALLTAAFMAVLLGILHPIYYANDDAMLRSILSGSFSSTASSKTVYLGQLVSLPISLLYRILPAVPWFDLFQILCLGISFWLILYRTVGNINTVKYKIISGVFVFCFLAGILMQQLVLPTYTVTAAIVGCTGIFYLFAAEEGQNKKQQLVLFLPAILLLVLCFEIRQNMFFMAFPFAALVVLYRMLGKGNFKEKLIRYLPSIGLFAVLIFVCLFIESVSYASSDWKYYKQYNEVRTLVYDYTGIDCSDAALQRYGEMGIADETISLYRNYKILLAEQQDLETMEKIAAVQPAYGIGWRNAVYTYVTLFRQQRNDSFYLALGIAFYLVLIFMLWTLGRKKDVLWLGSLAAVRSGLWLYLIEQGRYPERITISLYILELAVLFGFFYKILLENGRDLQKQKTIKQAIITYSSVGILFLMFLITLVVGTKNLNRQYQETAEINHNYCVIFDYMKQQPENLFLLDVASFPNCPEYMFEENNKMDNYLLLGGWMTGSPLLADKLGYYGHQSAREAFLKGNNVYYVSKESECGIETEDASDIIVHDTISNGQDTFYIIKSE